MYIYILFIYYIFICTTYSNSIECFCGSSVAFHHDHLKNQSTGQSDWDQLGGCNDEPKLGSMWNHVYLKVMILWMEEILHPLKGGKHPIIYGFQPSCWWCRNSSIHCMCVCVCVFFLVDIDRMGWRSKNESCFGHWINLRKPCKLQGNVVKPLSKTHISSEAQESRTFSVADMQMDVSENCGTLFEPFSLNWFPLISIIPLKHHWFPWKMPKYPLVMSK